MQPEDFHRVKTAVDYLKRAQRLLLLAGATKAWEKTRLARRSAEGAERHVKRVPDNRNETLWGPVAPDPRCPTCGELPSATLDRIELCEAYLFFKEGSDVAHYGGNTEVFWDGQESMIDEGTGRVRLWCPNDHDYPAPPGFKVQ